MSELLNTSAATWRTDAGQERFGVGLQPPRGAGPIQRARALLDRHHARTDHAQDAYRESRSPKQGFPVATLKVAGGFLAGMLKGRRRLFGWAVAANILAAGAGLVAPFLLGDLIDQVTGGRLALDGLTTLVLIVSGVIALQALFTFLARRASAVLGYDLLAAAREEVVRIVLRASRSAMSSHRVQAIF